MTQDIHNLFPELNGKTIKTIRNVEHFMGGYDAKLNSHEGIGKEADGVEIVFTDGTVLIVQGSTDEGVRTEVTALAALDPKRNKDLGING